jgi:hypothetical protein
VLVSGKASGTGTVDTACGVAEFDFQVQAKVKKNQLSGQLKYSVPGGNINLKSTSITSFDVTGNTATFEGTCTVNGKSCKFSVYIEDNANPGAGSDVFRISINGGDFQGGTIQSGNIKIK